MRKLKENGKSVKIFITGKYSKLEDSYHSVIWALKHAAAECDVNVEYFLADSTMIDLEYIKEKFTGIELAKKL